MGQVSTLEDLVERADSSDHERGSDRRAKPTHKGVRTLSNRDDPEITGEPIGRRRAKPTEVQLLREEVGRLEAENARLRAQLKEKNWQLRTYKRKSVRTVGNGRVFRVKSGALR